LLDKIKAYAASRGEKTFKARVLVDLLMAKVPVFNQEAVYLPSRTAYQEYLTTVFSRKTESAILCFSGDKWERINALQNRLNISTGDFIRLVAGSYLYPSGPFAVSLTNLATVFAAERRSYQYNLVLTRPVMDMLSRLEGSSLPINREVIIRAAHHYYASGLGTKPPLSNETRYRIDNETTGWSRITISGSQAMKQYYFREKKQTGKPLGTLISHTLYSFLGEMLAGETA
jgi:hypothetical protein